MKIEEVLESQKTFSKDDVVLAKCYQTAPWPAIIRSFWGYNNNEVELYTVDFLGTNLQAILESEHIVALSERKIGILKRTNKKNKKLLNALTMAKKALTILKKSSRNDLQRFKRFCSMYEVDLQQDKEDLKMIDRLQNQANVSRQFSLQQQDRHLWQVNNKDTLSAKQKKKRDRLTLNSAASITIEVKLINRDTVETKTTIAGIVAVDYCRQKQPHKQKTRMNTSHENLQRSGRLDNSFQNQEITR